MAKGAKTQKLTEEEKKFLLSLARKSIRHYLEKGAKMDLAPADVPTKRLTEDGACFVSLHIGGELRGCIGSLEAHRPLVMDVIDNALACAFGDPRFFPLSKEELPKVKISISVLTKPECLPVKDSDDLLKKLVPGKHGLIMEKGTARATFLPVVWEQLPKKEEFLEHLSLKACLAKDGWKSVDCRFYVYEAEEFSE
jgi:AmmeMemoRadiSam system protein A